jgi:RNA polymerase sigma-70 factor (ECF subfamily)
MNNQDISELVKKFLDGDNQAFTMIVDRFQKKIYSLAYNILKNHLDADEVVQETFVRVYKKRKELADVKYFTSFVIRIASNYSIDLLRKSKGHSGMAEDSTSLPGDIQLKLSQKVATPLDEYNNKRIMKEIRKALEQLPPKQRLTAILHDIEGYSKAEIARSLDCPEATVRSNLHIARSKLKKILKTKLDRKE